MHTKLGDVLRKQSEYDGAESEYNEALRIDPDNTKAMSGLADTFESTERADEAVSEMEKIETLVRWQMRWRWSW